MRLLSVLFMLLFLGVITLPVVGVLLAVSDGSTQTLQLSEEDINGLNLARLVDIPEGERYRPRRLVLTLRGRQDLAQHFSISVLPVHKLQGSW